MTTSTKAPSIVSSSATGTLNHGVFQKTGRSCGFCFGFALLIFVLLNLVVSYLADPKPDEVTHAIMEFQHSPNHATVFAGSSTCNVVSHVIDENSRQRFGIANLAFNLEMISDTYLVCDQLLKTHPPDRLVLCVMPRDFSDRDLQSPCKTTAFRRLVTLWNCLDYIQIYTRNGEEAVSAFATITAPMYRCRAAVQRYCLSKVSKTDEQRPRTIQQAWQRSLREYQWRYQGISESAMSVQYSFLERLLSLCEKRGIPVLLVHLPVSKVNQNLLPRGVLHDFSQHLHQIVARHKAEMLDLSLMELSVGDFCDCAHLSEEGSGKAWRVVKSKLVSLDGSRQKQY